MYYTMHKIARCHVMAQYMHNTYHPRIPSLHAHYMYTLRSTLKLSIAQHTHREAQPAPPGLSRWTAGTHHFIGALGLPAMVDQTIHANDQVITWVMRWHVLLARHHG